MKQAQTNDSSLAIFKVYPLNSICLPRFLLSWWHILSQIKFVHLHLMRCIFYNILNSICDEKDFGLYDFMCRGVSRSQG